MARKTSVRLQREIRPTLVGAGKTELFYFMHLRDLYNLKFRLQPRFFGNENVTTLEKRIEKVLEDGGNVIAVFDADVSVMDTTVADQFDRFMKKYAGKDNVVLCDSLPSIEYWFLLHFINSDRGFPTSKSVEKELKKHIDSYEKKEKFLAQKKWVVDLCSDGKMEQAYSRAKTTDEFSQSYSRLWRALEAIGLLGK